MISLNVILFALVVVCITGIYASLRPRRIPKGAKELPGPKGYPIIGNLLQIPKTHSWLKFKEWADEYGPIYKIHVLGSTYVVISSEKIANDLLSMRGAIYSDRPYFVMGYDLVTRGGNLVFNGMNDYWRRGRKFAQAQLSTTGSRSWQGIQAMEAPRLICDLVEQPSNYSLLFERYSTIVSLRQGFGKSVERGPQEESHARKIMSLMHVIERVASPFAYLVDVLPVLMRLPECLAPFKREGKIFHQQESSYFLGLLADARKVKEEGQPEEPPSFARSYLNKPEYWNLSDFEAAYTIGTLYGGGSGTTSSTMQTYCLTMCHYPEWQKRLQDEIDQVVGNDRIPRFDDMPNLPCVRAVVKEMLRWRPVVSGGVPHRLIQDDIYEGYFIPAGTVVHANQWAIHREEALYPDPETFRPERWLEPEYPTFRAPLTEFPNLKRFSAFGFGRRICPGLESAENALFIQVSSLAWACNVTRKKDKDGNDIPVPLYDYSAGTNTAPKPFAFDLIPRSQERLQLMRESSTKQ
ncbi:hypothetical protein B7463_g12342, partial [Scytalidium lignicola]